jgi:hypothetical protein
MNSDEDEAGAVHDDAGEVHSDGPGGVSEAGVVHAPVHNLGDIFRAVRATAEAGGKVGNTEDMRGVVSKVARRHARRRERHRGRCAQFGGCPHRCARRRGMHGGSDREWQGQKLRQWPRFVWWELMWTRKLHVFPESAGSMTLSFGCPPIVLTHHGWHITPCHLRLVS